MSHGEIFARAVARLGLEGRLPIIELNARESSQTLENARRWLTDRVSVEEAGDVDVAVLGSHARLEASGESDFDYLIVVYSLPEDVTIGRRLLDAADSFIKEELDTPGRSRRPGRTGLFGQIAVAADLTERIGLEQDTNISHSRRLLLLEESRSIYQPELHSRLLRAICERYLVDYRAPKHNPPRFLVNDVIRYWFTLAVDYQAKRWQSTDAGWGLRYLKLLNSRKVSYAGTLATLLRCSERQEASKEYLQRQFDKTSLTRLAELALDEEFDQHEALRRVLLCAEQFAAFLFDGDARERVKRIRALEDAETEPVFQEMRSVADELQTALQTIFFSSYLLTHAQRYLVF